MLLLYKTRLLIPTNTLVWHWIVSLVEKHDELLLRLQIFCKAMCLQVEGEISNTFVQGDIVHY